MHTKLALNRTYLYFAIAFAIKILLAAVTPFSADFLGNVLSSESSWQTVLSSGFYAPWFAVIKAITTLWTVLPIEHSNLQDSLGFWYIAPNLSTMTLLMMQKAPLLIFDAATAVTVGRVVSELGSARAARGAVLVWLANPFVTLITEMWATWDIVSAFFLLVAVLMFAKGKFAESGGCMGLGIAAKMYPLLALPVFVMFLTREKVKSGMHFLAGLAGAYLVAGLTPMMLAQGSKTSAATSGQISYFGGNVWGYTLQFYDIGISVLVVASVLFAFGYLILWKSRRTSIVEAVICFYLLVFAFTYWEPQFLLNLLPLLTVLLFTAERRRLPFIVFMSSALGFVLLNFAFYWTSWGHSFFFIPNYDEVLQHYSNLLLFARQWPIGGGSVNTIVTTPIRSVFVAISLYYSLWIFVRNSDKRVLSRVLGQGP